MDTKMATPYPFGKVSTHQKSNGQAGYAFQNDNKIRAKQVQ
jgi:hypothetical protein